ncbi:MAG: helix-turn-helix transcriptional regulator [Clostridia bacterium]|nr:helix-turn-helix transcriptional regulator [Clostridia bacterium]
MVDYIKVIDQKRSQIGMTIRALARKIDMDDDLLGKTLHRKRKMTATELIKISCALDLTMDDYFSTENEQKSEHTERTA